MHPALKLNLDDFEFRNHSEREPFVHSGVQSDVSAWNKAGTSFETKLWQRSHVAGWRSTSSNTRRRLRRHESGYLSVMAMYRQSPVRCDGTSGGISHPAR
jgi:hypothetical protein